MSMNPHRSLIAGFLLVLSLIPQGSALAADPIPAVCGTKVPQLTENEMLVERTLYFHGTDRLGDVQGGGNAVGTPFYMDATAPTGTETKYKSSKPGVFGNDAFGRNAVNGYWLTELEAISRVVCAGSKFYALSPADSINILLYFDKPHTEQTIPPVSTGSASAPAGNGVRLFSGNFSVPGKTGKVAETDIHIQFAPAAPGAVLAYDSTEAPASFTYVTIEPKPAA